MQRTNTTIFSPDTFHRQASNVFVQFAGQTSGLAAPEAHAAFLAMGGRPTMPLERIVTLMPHFTFSNKSLLSLSAFTRLVGYLCNGPEDVQELHDELDAIYTEVADLKADQAAAQHESSTALSNKRTTRDDAHRMIETVLALHGDMLDVDVVALLKLAWEHAVDEAGRGREDSPMCTPTTLRADHARAVCALPPASQSIGSLPLQELSPPDHSRLAAARAAAAAAAAELAAAERAAAEEAAAEEAKMKAEAEARSHAEKRAAEGQMDGEALAASNALEAQALGLPAVLDADEAARAIEWCKANGAKSMDDIVEAELLDEFVAALSLPKIPAIRLRKAMATCGSDGSVPHRMPQPSSGSGGGDTSTNGGAAATPTAMVSADLAGGDGGNTSELNGAALAPSVTVDQSPEMMAAEISQVEPSIITVPEAPPASPAPAGTRSAWLESSGHGGGDGIMAGGARRVAATADVMVGILGDGVGVEEGVGGGGDGAVGRDLGAAGPAAHELRARAAEVGEDGDAEEVEDVEGDGGIGDDHDDVGGEGVDVEDGGGAWDGGGEEAGAGERLKVCLEESAAAGAVLEAGEGALEVGLGGGGEEGKGEVHHHVHHSRDK